ncbi:MAG: tryptophan synthase subunit alpha [Lysobacterales bacterium]
MSGRIEARFAERAGEGRCLLVAFLTAGDPDPALTAPAMTALVDAGADLIELGMPFSDPMADGPVIQQSSERALAKGVGLAHVLDAVRQFRRADAHTPVVLMGYLNPLEQVGLAPYALDAAAAGVDGMLIVDCPAEEIDTSQAALAAADLRQIFLVAPTTSADRVQRICDNASGFIYYVSLKGITGADSLAADSVCAALQELRQLSRVPVGVGFGIKTPAQAAALAGSADAIVVGSAVVEALAPARDVAALSAAAQAVLGPLRQAIDQARNKESS